VKLKEVRYLANLDFFLMFFSFLFAFIVKDFYDIFISNHIKKWLSAYKFIVTKTNNIDDEIKKSNLKVDYVKLNKKQKG
jgi:multisubunit Na+/H+ antiporter MnhE subunit